MPPQNQNQNQNNFVTNFSNGKISVEKMDVEPIMQEKKITDPNLRQFAEKAIKSKPLLIWENNKLVINPGEDGFKPDADDLDRMIQLDAEQIQNLSQEAKDQYHKSLAWVMLGRMMQDQKKKENEINENK